MRGIGSSAAIAKRARSCSRSTPIHRRLPAIALSTGCTASMRDKIMNFFAFAFMIWRADMADRKYLTAEEVSDRYRGAVSVATLRNWRAMRVGPAFVKIGKAVLYPIDELDAWDKRNMVSCRVLDD
jgi:hypothetical protein